VIGRRGPNGFLAGLLAGALVALAALGLVREWRGDDLEELSLTDQAREVIEANYFEDVEAEELERASVDGMVERLRREYRDRYSHYFDPEELERFQQATSGEFSGVGLTVTEVPRGLRVAGVFPDTPAERADLRPGDVIVAVDGESIAGTSSEVATARIKGPAGTKVTLRVLPHGDGKPRELTLERARVRIPAANGVMLRRGGTRLAYVVYSTFSRGSHGELREEIERLRRRGAEGLILDLRGNGGGLLNEAVLSASLFVKEGTIVITRSRSRGEQVYEAVGDALPQQPTVVLINRDTASSAEILASAMAEHDVAELVGTRTFGKFTFQEVIQLPAGGALDLTVGEYLTASGASLASKGVRPDVRVADNPRTRRDEALATAVRELRAALR
jgi:carboxyl-terminal processing protease